MRLQFVVHDTTKIPPQSDDLRCIRIAHDDEGQLGRLREATGIVASLEVLTEFIPEADLPRSLRVLADSIEARLGATSDTGTKVRPGFGIEDLSAGDWNDFLDVSNAYKAGHLDPPESGAAGFERSQTELRIQNNGSGVCADCGILGIDGPIFSYAQNPNEFKYRVSLAGNTPAASKHTGKFAIAIGPIGQGAIGRAIVSGLAVCQISMTGPTDKYADVTDGNTSYLTSGGAGAAQILWTADTSGIVWAIVRLVVTPPKAMQFYNADSVDAPSHACMQIVGDTVIGGQLYISIKRPFTLNASGNVYTGPPGTDIMRAQYVFNLCGTVAAGDTGTCEFASSSADFPTLALFDSSDPSPQALDVWGPCAGDWVLRYGLPGFKVLASGVDQTDQGGCQASTSDPVVRIIRSDETDCAPWLFYALNGTNETQVPAFAALSLGAYETAGGFPCALQVGPAAGFIVSGAGPASGNTDPCYTAWSVMNGAQAPSGATGALGRTASDGFTRPIPVLVTAQTSYQPTPGGVCGPIPTTSASDPNRFCFGDGLPGWRCVSGIWTSGSGSSTIYGCYVVRDHLTARWGAKATTNWNSSGGSSNVGYVTCYAVTTRGGALYDGVGSHPKAQFNVLCPSSPGCQDPNIQSGNYIEYGLGAGLVAGIGPNFATDVLFWINVAGAGGLATVASPYLDDKIGTIKIFNGTVPQGWAVCDGTNGTVDLRGRLICGPGDYGGTGLNPSAVAGQLISLKDSIGGDCVVTSTASTGAPGTNQFSAIPSIYQPQFIQRVK